MAKHTWKTFFDVLAFVVVFAVPVILYLMEKAEVALKWIFVLGWVSIAIAALYLSLSIPWVWADVPLPFRVWRACLVSSLALLLVGYGAINIWPKGHGIAEAETKSSKTVETKAKEVPPTSDKEVSKRDAYDTENAKNSSPVHHNPPPPSAIVQQFSAPYGNLANRCKELGQAIVNAADERAKIMPTFPAPVTEAQRAQYNDWYMQNDGVVFHAHFWNEAVKLQKDLRAVSITDTRLDELLERHASNFARRNQEVELAIKHPTLYHCSIEDIRETGERFLYLATQVPK